MKLPSYRKPPVTEVVAGLTFKRLEGLTTPLIVEAWRTKYAEKFPNVQEQPQYVPPTESFDFPEIPSRLSIAVELPAATSPRFWFVSSDQQALVQLQGNWFACNWRKVRPEAEYGRWHTIRAEFERQFNNFLDFCKERSLGKVEVEQTEVTYVNHIDPGSAWDSLAEMDKVVRIMGMHDRDLLPVDAEQMTLRATYRIADATVKAGRLHVSVDPGLKMQDMRPLIAMTLTGRSTPISADPSDAVSSMDVSRDWIVRCFTAITTEAAHKQWERYE
jgi:uncharacterized protein (TIGR04255 family)